MEGCALAQVLHGGNETAPCSAACRVAFNHEKFLRHARGETIPDCSAAIPAPGFGGRVSLTKSSPSRNRQVAMRPLTGWKNRGRRQARAGACRRFTALHGRAVQSGMCYRQQDRQAIMRCDDELGPWSVWTVSACASAGAVRMLGYNAERGTEGNAVNVPVRDVGQREITGSHAGAPADGVLGNRKTAETCRSFSITRSGRFRQDSQAQHAVAREHP